MATVLAPSGPYLHRVIGKVFNEYRREVWPRCSDNDRARLKQFAVAIDSVFKREYGVTAESLQAHDGVYQSFMHGDLWIAIDAGVLGAHKDTIRSQLKAAFLEAGLEKDEGSRPASTQRNWAGFMPPTVDAPAGMLYISFRRSLPL